MRKLFLASLETLLGWDFHIEKLYFFYIERHEKHEKGFYCEKVRKWRKICENSFCFARGCGLITMCEHNMGLQIRHNGCVNQITRLDLF